MPGRRFITLAHLPFLIAIAGCYRAPMRSSLTSARTTPDEISSRSATAAIESESRRTLALVGESRTTFVDLQDDSAAFRAIRSFLGARTSELSVESDGTYGRLRLKPDDRFGDYARLFVVDGVPLANGFGLSIRTTALERIELLDDSLSKAPYGPRATNGVVLISTTRSR
jgi:hypothetical protein